MPYNPLKDQKFLTLLVDVASALLLYFAGKYAPASIFDDIKVVWGLAQPLVAMYIAGLFQADAALMKKGGIPKHLL